MPAPGLLKVKSVAELVGVSPHTVRAWERRYGAVSPGRTDKGGRLYSTADVERLRLLSKLIDQGYAISQLAPLKDDELLELQRNTPSYKGAWSQGTVSADFASRTGVDARAGDKRTLEDLSDRSDVLARIVDALEAFDLLAISRLLEGARNRSTAREFVLELAAPILAEVGTHVARGSFSVSQEHALSAILRGQLGRLLETAHEAAASAWTPGDPAVALATVEGDLHEFGVLMSAILCAARGVPAFYLGPNLPVKGFAESARRLRATIAILGTTPLPEGTLKKPYEAQITTLATLLPKNASSGSAGEVISSRRMLARLLQEDCFK